MRAACWHQCRVAIGEWLIATQKGGQENLLSWPAAVCWHPGHGLAECGQAGVDCPALIPERHLSRPASLVLCEEGLQMVVCWHPEYCPAELGQADVDCPAETPEAHSPCRAWQELYVEGLQMVVELVEQVSESWRSEGPVLEGSGQKQLVPLRVSCLLTCSFEACACLALYPHYWLEQQWLVHGGHYSSLKLHEEQHEGQALP